LKIQEILRRLLDKAAAGAGTVFVEFGFRPKSEREYRIADVAYTANERLARMDSAAYFEGSPELIIEVLSPSNTAPEIADKKTLYLETGCQEFWVVDIGRRKIDVSTPSGHITYECGQEIPLMFGGTLTVDAIFAEHK
jgi:Uma2 family endonuclease